MKTHEIRLNIEFCDDVMSGKKSFEIRNNDRGYQTGDLIQFIATNGYCSVDPFTHERKEQISHPINEKTYRIEYVLNGWGLKNGYVALAIRDIETECFTVEQYGEMLKIAEIIEDENKHLSDKHWEECRQIALYDDQLRRAVELLKRARRETVSYLPLDTMRDIDELLVEIGRTEVRIDETD